MHGLLTIKKLNEAPSLSIVSTKVLKKFDDDFSKIILQRIVWDRYGDTSIEFNIVVTADCSGSTTFQYKTFKLAAITFELLKAGLQ